MIPPTSTERDRDAPEIRSGSSSACVSRNISREPEALFWSFGFPILLAIGLGIAFRSKPPDDRPRRDRAHRARVDRPRRGRSRQPRARSRGSACPTAPTPRCAPDASRSSSRPPRLCRVQYHLRRHAAGRTHGAFDRRRRGAADAGSDRSAPDRRTARSASAARATSTSSSRACSA